MTTAPDRTELAAAALAAAARGWHVFPLTPGDKRPLPKFTDWEHRATTDPARIRRCWDHGPYNIGIACGPSGLLVIDLDKPKPGEHPPPAWANEPGITEGADVLAALCERHGADWPGDTFTATTRRGGMHLYFTPPPGTEFRNTNGKHRTGLGWLIDTRAHGGYVVAPGSVVDLPDGTGRYEVVHDVAPAPLPDWIARLLTEVRAPAPLLGALPADRDGVGDLPAYVQAALKAEADRVATAVPGGRNHALNKAAYNLGRLVGAGLLAEDLAAEVLYNAAGVHFGPTRADVRPGEARATIRSALAAGARRPRHITMRGSAA
ncbi:DNA primase [Actinomadura craniellae]|uniref:DNA primase n=1 Tax=Actinomadura craniellae TaxID=2231787 RepID=A0A365HBG0_9ACTN|nr:bifunctional DNA primase/polymerase [Actinomadura craniellae]RAY16379.1 DNA primase [Actinomadura craniellae]